jgi:hypothetical protein
MTVKQLIEALKQVPPNMQDIEVRIESSHEIVSVSPKVAWFNKNREVYRESIFVIEI